MQQYFSVSSRSLRQRTTTASMLRTTRTIMTTRLLAGRQQTLRKSTPGALMACRRLVGTTTSRAVRRSRSIAAPLKRQQPNSNKRGLRKGNKVCFSSQAVHPTTTESSATLSSSSSNSRFGAGGEQTNLSWQGARALFVASAVPMVGFGFMDNLVMIQAGQYIDSTLGVKLGLATMTAAACGQVVSDVSGVLFGGTVETFINRWMPNPVATSLSLAQRQSTWGRYASLAGAVIGVTVGCALGALTLFFVDLDARDRIQRAGQFKEVLTDMTQNDVSNGGDATTRTSFPCRQVVVHLAVKANQKYDWRSINRDGSSEDGKPSHVRMCSLDLQDVENGANMVAKAARQQGILSQGHRLYAPIMLSEKNKQDDIWAVVEFVKDGDEVSEADMKKVELMSSHLAIFLHRMAD